jgi:3-dehydro-L-gulonate 2-dehydrogenase
MAMQQFSYGKMQEYELKGEQLPVKGGYDEKGSPTSDPSAINKTKRPMPIGFWKGSALSFMLDVMISCLSDGRPTSQISKEGKEYGVSQIFICIHPGNLNESMMNEIIDYTRQSNLVDANIPIRYPGEKTLATRIKNSREGTPVNENIWQQVLDM